MIGPNREIIAKYGDPGLNTYIRSAAKPFQILPFLSQNLHGEYNFSDKEIAVCCSSHSGEQLHVELVESILSKTGIDKADLACGIHQPLGKEVRRKMAERGVKPSVLHNNCSGKHSAMLATAKFNSEPLKGYLNSDHPVQIRILEVIKKYSEKENVKFGIDGCSAPVFYLSLKKIALMYQKLAAADDSSELSNVWNIMTSNPLLVAGTGRFDSLIMEAGDGNILSKMGAEGLQCMAFKTENGPLGLAVKVQDGSRRGVVPATLYILDRLGMTPEGDFESLKEPILRNHMGIEIGEIRVQEE